VIVKGFYLLLHSRALKTFSLSPLKIQRYNIHYLRVSAKGFYLLLNSTAPRSLLLSPLDKPLLTFTTVGTPCVSLLVLTAQYSLTRFYTLSSPRVNELFSTTMTCNVQLIVTFPVFDTNGDGKKRLKLRIFT